MEALRTNLGVVSLLDLEAFENHAGRIHGFQVERIASRTDIGQNIRFELMPTIGATHERWDFGQGQGSVLSQAAFLFHDVEAELDVFGTVARERVEADFDQLDPLCALGSGLFLDNIEECAD